MQLVGHNPEALRSRTDFEMCHLHPFNVKLFTVAAKLKALACIRLKWVHKLDHMSRV